MLKLVKITTMICLCLIVGIRFIICSASFDKWAHKTLLLSAGVVIMQLLLKGFKT